MNARISVFDFMLFQLRVSFPDAGEATRLKYAECVHPFASGHAGRSPIRFALGWVNLRTGAGAACGTYS